MKGKGVLGNQRGGEGKCNKGVFIDREKLGR